MQESISPLDVPSKPNQIDKSTSSVKAEQMEKDKYRSEPVGKVKISDYLRVFSYATRWDLAFLFVGSLASIGAGTTLPLMNIVFGNLVGDLNSYFSPDSNVLQDEFTSRINKNTLNLVYLFIAKLALAYVSMYSFRITGIRLSAAIRLAYLRALFSQSISSLDKLPPGQSAGMITASANLLQIGISEKLSICLQFTSLLISAYIVAFKYSWQLTLVASSILLFVLVVFGIIIPISTKLQKSVDHANEKASSIASEVFGSIRMVVACGAEKRVVDTYSKWIDEARRRGLKLSPVLGTQFAPVFFAIYADMALTFWFGMKLYNESRLDDVRTVLIAVAYQIWSSSQQNFFGEFEADVYSVLMSVMMSVFSLSNIVAPLNAAIKAAGAASSFFIMIDAPSIKKDGLKEPDVSAGEDISFRGVTFAYPSRPHVKVLDGLDVCFEAGKLTAIVGPSGSGKSTIVGLMERWYELAVESETDREPASGSDEKSISDKGPASDKELVNLSGMITVGGQDIRGLDLKWWRSQIGLVQQEPFIFNDTIYKNVANGLVGSKFENESDEMKKRRVEEACKEAFADEFISRLPMGYETKVGDSGIKLSGGQRQRLAIARSIIKRPTILIFDEATSAIDVRGERIVQDALDRVVKNRTTVTIAHRLSTIKKADKIIVVAKGKVVEQGTHEGLLAKDDGVYSNLVHAQKLTMDDHVEDLLKVPSLELAVEDPVIEEKAPASKAKETPYKLRGFLGSFGLLLVEQKAHILWLVLTLIGAIGSATAFPLQAYIFAQVVVVFQKPRGQEMQDESSHWALMFLILALCIGATYLLVGWAASTLSTNVACTYRLEYFASITKKPIEFYDADENSSGTLTSRVANDPTQLQEMMGINMSMVLVALFSIIGCLAIAFSFGWKLTLVSAVPALPLITIASFYRVRFEIQFEKLNALVFAESSQFAAEAFGAFRTVTALTLEDMICDRYAALLEQQVNKAKRKARFTTLVFALSDSIVFPCMALTFWYGGRLLATLEYDVIKYLVVYMAVINGSESAGTWCSFGPNMAQASAAANRILSLRDWSQTLQNVSKISLPGSDSQGGAEITFSDVYFKYPTRDIPIFNGLNMTVKKGQFAGLVGASGCGKTTIISLLEQFYQVDQGKVTFDGVNINDINIREYRSVISLVAQEPTLFQGTIRENILLAVEDGSASEADLHQACRNAEIHDFISSLPEGYGTDIGSKGVALSGGQKQRIAIARALIRKPRILLLDEATSSLDSESEKLVQAAFEKAGKGRTMVVVAHRLATVQNADVIFVLGNAGDGARVLEKGSHAELVAMRGVYYQMCQSQALDR